ncbi:hypothetical protein FPZ12_014270 [Amycolatopsis acidicola]|uniref:Uncharacterized protein n=1 Tax=Amycolatopsis acidicola TaxID=2596893 RepID=A0A5N0V7V2_9PSEU|nr:hypothetical protein [Amycolatopsis acidicola]KAA9161313.1 hypothetical protein FPZ12_014270 [Amycolatopsis acidicola]
MAQDSLDVDVAAFQNTINKYADGNEQTNQVRTKLFQTSSSMNPSAMGGRALQAANNVGQNSYDSFQQHYNTKMQPVPDDFTQAARTYSSADQQGSSTIDRAINL